MEIIIAILLIRLVLSTSGLLKMIKIKPRRLRFKTKNTNELFDQYFIEARVFYTKMFNSVPCVAYIGNVDTTKIFELINTNKYDKVKETLQRIYHDYDDDAIHFSKTIFILENKVMVKLCDDWLEIYFNTKQHALANTMLNDFKTLKANQKNKDFEINIISLSGKELDLKTLPIKSTKLNIDIYYNDDFKAVDAIIKERLSKENDKGIVLLHGLPGTGKTTYLRCLIGSLKKKVMFVSPAVAGNLMNPEFMDLLLDNPNSVLVIEDAENIIMDRKFSNESGVSNLLNISDGLLSDCLNVQIICTFNSDLNLIDNALLRKGRLIARYEFGKLSIDKAKNLRDHLGLKTEINRPMTLAEITNPDDIRVEPVRTNTIGFRREVLMQN